MPPHEVELAAAQALFAARMMEAAVHDDGPWFFRWGSVEVPATRTINAAGVTFTGQFPDACYLTPPTGGLVLLCRDTVMGMRSMDADHPGDTGFVVTWAILASQDRVSP